MNCMDKRREGGEKVSKRGKGRGKEAGGGTHAFQMPLVDFARKLDM